MSDILVNTISAKTGGIVTHTQNLVERFAERHIAATFYVPADFAQHFRARSTVRIRPAIAGRYGAMRRFLWEQTYWRGEIQRSRAATIFAAANFGLLWPSIPQLLLIREGGLFNPLYIKHVLPRLGARRQVETYVRRELMLLSARSSNIVMFPSETVRDWVLSYLPSLEKRTLVNPYGPGIPPASRRDEPLPWRSGGPLRLLFVSVYYPHKDPVCLARAVRALRSRGIDASARITMKAADFDHWSCGAEDYAALREAEQAGDVTLGDIVHSEIAAAYRACDAFVFPSVSETFGFPLLEAMAVGRPIVAADTLINREICGPAALYYPPFDAVKLADRLQQLDQRPDLRSALVEEGLARLRRRFLWEDHIGTLIDTLQRLSRSQSACAA